MLYLQKFIAAWLLPPGCIILALSLLCIYCFSQRSRILYLLTVVTLALYLLSTLPMAAVLLKSLEQQYQPPALAELSGQTDAIIVLGGGAISGVPDTGGSGALAAISMNRLITGLRLQKQLQVPIVISGGQVFAGDGTEATLAQRVLLELDVPQQQIFVDAAARNTTENAANIATICKEQNWHKLVLVTSAFHMPRSMQNFAGSGLLVKPYPCDYQLSSQLQLSIFSFVPQGFALELSALALKEYLGMLALKIL